MTWRPATAGWWRGPWTWGRCARPWSGVSTRTRPTPTRTSARCALITPTFKKLQTLQAQKSKKLAELQAGQQQLPRAPLGRRFLCQKHEPSMEIVMGNRNPCEGVSAAGHCTAAAAKSLQASCFMQPRMLKTRARCFSWDARGFVRNLG